MNVLSLFDGCGMSYTALKRLGIPVTTYYASEVDPYPIKVAMANHPDIVQMGDVQLTYRRWLVTYLLRR